MTTDEKIKPPCECVAYVDGRWVCHGCDCHNSGDLAEAAAWAAHQNAVDHEPEPRDEQIKALREALEIIAEDAEFCGEDWGNRCAAHAETARKALALTEPAEHPEQEADGWRPMVERLVAAVEALPVEEWVETCPNGEAMLVGYVMQAQGEWDEARNAAADLRKALTAPPADKEGA